MLSVAHAHACNVRHKHAAFGGFRQVARIPKHFFHYLLHERRGYGAAEYRAHLRLVNQYQANVLRVVRRGEAYERCYKLTLRNLAVGAVLLRGAGLSAHPVSGYGGVFAAAFAHYAFGYLPHKGGGFLAYHAAHHSGPVLQHNRTVRRNYAVHHIRLHEVAAVYRRAYRRNQLQRRYRYALPKAYAGKRIIGNVLLVRNYARAFPGYSAAR